MRQVLLRQVMTFYNSHRLGMMTLAAMVFLLALPVWYSSGAWCCVWLLAVYPPRDYAAARAMIRRDALARIS